MIVGEMGDLKLSVDLARKAVAIPQGDFRPALILAIYCAKSGLLDEAQKAIERVLEIMLASKINEKVMPQWGQNEVKIMQKINH